MYEWEHDVSAQYLMAPGLGRLPRSVYEWEHDVSARHVVAPGLGRIHRSVYEWEHDVSALRRNASPPHKQGYKTTTCLDFQNGHLGDNLVDGVGQRLCVSVFDVDVRQAHEAT